MDGYAYEIRTYSDVYCILVDSQIHETCIKQAICIKMQGEIYKCPWEMENGMAKGNGKDWVNPMRKWTTSTYVYYNTTRLFCTKNVKTHNSLHVCVFLLPRDKNGNN